MTPCSRFAGTTTLQSGVAFSSPVLPACSCGMDDESCLRRGCRARSWRVIEVPVAQQLQPSVVSRVVAVPRRKVAVAPVRYIPVTPPVEEIEDEHEVFEQDGVDMVYAEEKGEDAVVSPDNEEINDDFQNANEFTESQDVGDTEGTVYPGLNLSSAPILGDDGTLYEGIGDVENGDTAGETMTMSLLGAEDKEVERRCCLGMAQLLPAPGVSCSSDKTVGSPGCAAYAAEYAAGAKESIERYFNAQRTPEGWLLGTTLGTVGIPDVIDISPYNRGTSSVGSLSQCQSLANLTNALGAVATPGTGASEGKYLCWVLNGLDENATPLDYRVSRKENEEFGKRLAWLRPAAKLVTAPNDPTSGGLNDATGARLPAALTRICPALEGERVEGREERWRTGSEADAFGFCQSSLRRLCVGRIGGHALCDQWCAQTYSDCDDALRAYSKDRFDRDPTSAWKDPKTQCFLPGHIMDRMFNELQLDYGIVVQNKQLPCVHAPCIDSVYKPYAYKGTNGLRCPDIQQCFAQIRIDNEGRIDRANSKIDLKCFNQEGEGKVPPKPNPPRPRPKPDEEEEDDDGGGKRRPDRDDEDDYEKRKPNREEKSWLAWDRNGWWVAGLAAAAIIFALIRRRQQQEQQQQQQQLQFRPPFIGGAGGGYYPQPLPPQAFYGAPPYSQSFPY